MASPPSTLPPVTHAITQEQLFRYADASGDRNPLHLDPDFAAGTPYGGTIAHGMLVLAFLSEMMTRAAGMAWLTGGKLKVRFRATVYPGDTVTTRGVLRAPAAGPDPPRPPQAPGRLRVVYDVACRNQREEEVITGEASLRWPAG